MCYEQLRCGCECCEWLSKDWEESGSVSPQDQWTLLKEIKVWWGLRNCLVCCVWLRNVYTCVSISWVKVRLLAYAIPAHTPSAHLCHSWLVRARKWSFVLCVVEKLTYVVWMIEERVTRWLFRFAMRSVNPVVGCLSLVRAQKCFFFFCVCIVEKSS